MDPFVHVPEHGLGIIIQFSHDVDVLFQVQAHHRLELPEGDPNGILGIEQIRNRRSQGRLGPG